VTGTDNIILTNESNIDELPEKFPYNIDRVADFLDVVFHALPEDSQAEILTWATLKIPGYPVNEEKLYRICNRSPLGKALYYGTSTTVRTHEGYLRNRKECFNALHVLVLDDIGTKIPFERIPDDMRPTYRIESSKGNYQYGYVLAEPIKVYEHAEALVRLVYEAGFSDAGGKMPTKLVRLPDGINGKPGKSKDFKVRLDFIDGDLWTPEDLLQKMNLDLHWRDVVSDTSILKENRANQGVGLAPWADTAAQEYSTAGMIDPLFEWLLAERRVQQDNGDWVTVECPWCDDHTNADTLAHYSPLGRGGKLHANGRGFKCFHGHCTERNTSDYIQFMTANGAPEVPVFEHAAELVARFAYDPVLNSVWDVSGSRKPICIPMAGFRNGYPTKTLLMNSAGKMQKVPDSTLYINSKSRVTVLGASYDPSTTAKIVDIDGDKFVNNFTLPSWGTGDYDEAEVDYFKTFLAYLIPNNPERRYFTSWLASKAQTMTFRGAGIIMIALAQGTGRTTLGNMLSVLFGEENTQREDFSTIIGDNQFNEWRTAPIIITDETLDRSKDFYAAYEKLKTVVDQAPTRVTINPKFGRKYTHTTYSSFLMFSNHAGALSVSLDDRRFYVIENPNYPAEPAFFMDLYAWKNRKGEDGKPIWARHIWRWLQDLPVDMEQMTAPVESTAAKERMHDNVQSPIAQAVDAVLDAWPCVLIATAVVRDLINPFAVRLHMSDPKTLYYTLRAIMAEKTLAIKGTPLVNINRVKRHYRVIKRQASRGDLIALTHEEPARGEIRNIVKSGFPDDAGMEVVRTKLTERLNELDL